MYIIRKNKIERVIDEIQRKMIQNIKTGKDIDEGVDLDEIANAINSNKKQLVSSFILECNTNNFNIDIIPNNEKTVKVQDMLFYTSNIMALSQCFTAVRSEWAIIRKDKTQAILDKYLNARFASIYIDDDEIDEIMDLLSYFVYQTELSAGLFPYLLEQLSLKDRETKELYNAVNYVIDVSPLITLIINIDDIPYDANAVEYLQSQMRQKSQELTSNFHTELTDSINTQFDICVNNIDSYLNWYYGAFNNLLAQPVIAIIAALNPKKTIAEAIQEHKIHNYIEKIGNRADFGIIVNITERYRQKMLDDAIIYTSTLLNCNLDYSFNTKIIGDITGDEYMMSFSGLPNYIDKVIFEGLPIMGMGDTLDTDGILVVDALAIVINFIPGVGLIAGTGVDYIALKTTEHIKRPGLKEEITSSIRNDQRALLEVIRVDN
jgi:hypothetical protein